MLGRKKAQLEMIMKNVRFRRKSMELMFLSALLCTLAFAQTPLPIARAWVAAREAGHVSAAAVPGFHVSGRFLLDANGNKFVMRGINYPHNWYPEQTSSFQYMKAKGANTIRVVLSSGQLWPKNIASDVANVINLCKANKLVCVLEVHDTTGFGEASGAASLAQAVSYWKEIKSVLIGQEAYVIINLGNEPYGNVNTSGWINATKNAIADMRTAGFQHMLMVDAPDWGQDWEFIMRDNAASIFNSDPNKNTVFSIHMYGVFDTFNKIQSYLASFVNAGLPLVIGEFGHQHTDGNPDEDSIMSVAVSNEIGYLGWMWSGGGYLDMVANFNPNRLTSWGNRIINGENGICPTSYEASVYGGGLNSRVCSFTLAAIGTNDAWVLESSETSNTGGTINSTSTLLYVGDDAQDKQYRSFLSFNTSSLPDNAVITKIQLKIRHNGFAGTNMFTPIKTHNNLVVDIRKPYFGATPPLLVSDFQAAASRNVVGVLTSAPTPGWYTITLNSTSFPFANLAGATQFRLRFQKDDNDDLQADFLKIFSGDGIAAYRPILIIEYSVP
jgi:hypothetical protein